MSAVGFAEGAFDGAAGFAPEDLEMLDAEGEGYADAYVAGYVSTNPSGWVAAHGSLPVASR